MAFDNPNYVSATISSENENADEDNGFFSKGVQDPNFLKLVELNIWVPTTQLKFWPQVEVELREKETTGERFISVLSLIPLAKN